MGWCDDPDSPNYNRLIKIPNKYKYEKLYRKDNVYDLIMAINYNMNPIIKKKKVVQSSFMLLAKILKRPQAVLL